MSLFQSFFIFILVPVLNTRASVENYNDQDNEAYKTMTISMPLVETSYPDQYICFAHPIEDIDESYVLSSSTKADRSVVHHVATGVCGEPASSQSTWDCTHGQGETCKGDAVNFGGWDEFSKKNGVFEFPKDVSLKVGGKSELKYFIIEIHYMDPVQNPSVSAANVTLTFTKKPTKYNYQTDSLLNGGFIPGNTEKGFFSDVACEWNRPPAYAYRYFVHTHHYGILVEGFLIRNSSLTLIGSQLSMEKKRDLYVVPGGPLEIKQGDILAARCLYANKNNQPVKFGMSEGEEMCNFQIDIGYEPQYEDNFKRPPACLTESPTFNFCEHSETLGLCSK